MNVLRRSAAVLLLLPVLCVLASCQVNVTVTVDGVPARNGSSVVLRCNATGLQSAIYSWERRIADVEGSGVSSGSSGLMPMEEYERVSANNILEFSPIVFGNESVYRCVATNGSVMEEYISEEITLSISPEGSVIVSPSLQVRSEGDTATFTCSAMGGPENMFRWQKDGVILINETDTTLTLPNISASSDGGTYTCIVSNEAGNDTDSGDLYISPEITTQPASINTSVLVDHEFECDATGFPAPMFEWFKVGENLTGNFSGENTTTLRLTPVQFGDEGDYFCQVTSGNSTIQSERARLTISPQGGVSVSAEKEAFDRGENVTLTCSSMGGPGNLYQWYQNSTALAGENMTTLILTEVTAPADGDEYTCEVTNAAGSSNDTISLNINPVITENPTSVNVTSGENATLTCEAEAFPDPTYKWTYSNGTDISLSNVQGVETDTLQFLPAEFGSEGNYICSASANNVTVASEAATVSVSPEGTTSVAPNYTIAEVGDNVTFTCSAQGGPDNMFQWEHNDLSLDFTSATITIGSVTVADGGDYTCTVSNAAGMDNATATLFIMPRITTLPVDMQTVNGSVVEFTCEAEGFPTPNITWERVETDANTTLNDTGFLTLSPAVFGDEGSYQCVATSLFAIQSLNTTMELTVSELVILSISPLGSVEASPPEIDSARDQNQTFNCSAMGGPENTFNWTRLFGDVMVSQEPTLTILVNTANVGSDYRCTVENAAGNDSVDVTLRVAVLVDTDPQDSNVSRADVFTLTCTASAYPLPNITWIHNMTTVMENARVDISQVTMPRSVTSTLRVQNATTTDSGDYLCRVGAPPGSSLNTTDSDTALVLVQDIPARPYNVTGVNVTSQSLTLQWVEPHDSNAPILGYRVMYTQPDFLGSTMEVVNATEERAEISGLHPGVTYNFTVVAFNDIGDSVPSVVAGVRTSDEVPASPPDNVNAVNISSTAIRVTWDDVPAIDQNGIITQYEVEYNQTTFSGATMYNTTTVDSSMSMVDLTGLEEYVEYSIRVRAYTSVGAGPYSDVVIERTRQDVPASPPDNVTAVNTSSTAIRVTWNGVPAIDRNGIITQYEVEYNQTTFDGATMYNTTTVDSSMSMVVLTGLEEYVEYSIRVRAYTSVGAGPYSDVVNVTTSEDVPNSPPADVNAVNISSTAIRVTWNEVPAIARNGIITQYEVEYNQTTFSGATMYNTTTVDSSMSMVDLTGLEEYVEYSIRVRAYTSVGAGPYSDVVMETTQQDVPASPPANVNAVNISSTAIRVTWNEVPAIDQNGIITQYEVEYNQTTFNGATMSGLSTVDAPTLTVDLTGLEEYVEYFIRVRAYTSVGAGPYSDVVNVTTSEDVPNSPPANVNAVNISSTAIQVTWDEVPAIDQNGIITQYEVEYNQTTFSGATMSATTTVDAPTLTVDLTGLEEYVEYFIRVRAYTSVGAGPYSDVVIERTQQDVPASPPDNVTAVNTSSTAIRVTWNGVPAIDRNGIITQYEVEYNQTTFSGATMYNTTTVDAPTLTVDLTGLEEYVEYSIRVRAYTSVGAGPYSDVVNTTTSEDVPNSPPANVNAVNISSTAIRVTWNEVPPIDQNGIITQYEVEYNQTTFSGATMSATTTVDAPTLTVNLTGLEEFVEYSIRVRAYTRVGAGPYSDVVMETTQQDVPASPPADVNAVNISSTAIRVSWNEVPAIDRNGIITQYEVEYNQTTFSGATMYNTTTVDAPTLTVDLTGLEEYVEYSIRVRAYTSVGAGPYSDVVIERTQQDVPASPPDNVTAVNTSSTAIRVTWDEVPAIDRNGIITQYEVEYNQTTFSGATMFAVSTVDASTLTVDLTGLEEYVEYSIRVRAYTSVGAGPYSDVVMETTQQDVPASPPADVNAVNISSTAIRVSWNEVPAIDRNGIITQYEVEYNQTTFSGATMSATTTVDAPTLTVDLTGLEEYVEYFIRVRAYTSVGAGPYSDVVIERTQQDVPASPPDNVTAVNTSSTAIQVTWNEVPAIDRNGIITQYEVEYNQTTFSGATMSATTTVDAPTLTVNLTGLEEFVEYSIRVRAYTSVGAGPYSDVVMETTQQDVPASPPADVNAVNISSTAIRVSWNEVPAIDRNGIITQYEVEYNQTTFSGATMSATTTVDAPTLTVDLTGLEEYVEYSIRVRAYTSVGAGPYSDVVIERTQQDVPASPPDNVTAVNTSSTAIQVTWNEVPAIDRNGIITQYEVEYNQTTFSGATMSATTTVDAPTLTVDLTGLEEYVEYSIRVKAYTSVGAGPYSDVVMETTQQDAPSNFPQSLAVVSLSSTSLNVSWQPVPDIDRNGIITRYTVDFDPVQTFGGQLMNASRTVAASESYVVLEGLQEYVEYDVRVRASTVAGDGPDSPTVRQRTLEDAPASPPDNVNAVNISSTAIRVTWDEVPAIDRNGIITQYEVEYNQTTFSGATMYNTTTVDSSMSMVDLTGLEEYVEYSIRVRAYTSVGAGPYSDVVTETTQQDAPSNFPQSLAVVPLSSTSLNVSWQPVPDIDRNGIITRYTVDFDSVPEFGEQLTSDSVMVAASESYVVLEGLQKYMVYNVSVRASTVAGDGPDSPIVQNRTLEDVPGQAPLNVTAMNVSSTSLRVNWERPTPEFTFGELRAFIIRYAHTAQDGFNETERIPAEETEEITYMYVLEGLFEFTNYSVQVAAITIGPGVFSDPVFVVTDEDIPGPVLRLEVNRTEITTTTAIVRWEPPPDPNGEILRYTVNYTAVFMAMGNGMGQRRRRQSSEPLQRECIMGGEESISRITTVVGNPPDTFVELTDLTPFVTYQFRVQPETRVGKGDFSTALSFETDESVPTTPQNFTVSYLNSTSLEVTWAPPMCDYGIRTGYTLTHDPLPPALPPNGTIASNIPQVYSGLEAGDTRQVMVGLYPNTNYSVTLCAYTGTGCGEPVSTVSPTDEDAPMPIERLQITSSPEPDSDTTVSLTVTWTPPTTRNGTFRTEFTYSASQSDPYPAQRGNSTALQELTLDGDNTSVPISGALPFAEYMITVQPFNVKTGNKAASVSTTYRTIAIEPTVVLDLRAEGVSSTSIMVSWALPQYPNGGPVTHYNVYYLLTTTGLKQDPNNIDVTGYTRKMVNSTGAEETETVIDGLEVYRNYSIVVQAVVEVNGSETELNGALLEVVQRTFSDFPTVPPEIVIPGGDTTSTITISLPDHTYIDTGVVIFYAVVVIRGVTSEDQSFYDDAGPYVDGAQYYITAAWARPNVTRVPDSFTIGNGSVTYANGVTYVNTRLSSDSRYTVFVRIDLEPDVGPPHRIRSNYTTVRTDEEPLGYSPAGLGVGIVLIILAIAAAATAAAIIGYLYFRRPKDDITGEVATVDDMGISLPVVAGQIFANPLAPVHTGTFEPVPVRDFPDHVKRMHANDDFLFTEEYGAVEPDQAVSSEVCMRPENQSKNRYANIRAYDHSRVKLKALPDEIGSDYINANHIDGYKQPHAFIATQGPVPAAIPDFWRMIWEQGTATLVMLTNLEEKGRLKCHKYWPDEAERSKAFDLIRVHLQETLILAHYTVRTFSLQMDGSKEERIVKQYHYTAWPDHGVPEYPTSLLQFVRKVMVSNPLNAGPVVVHCSAGVGRTGTFITLDAQLRRIKAEQTLDIFGFVRAMRKRRCYMVQTEPQYIFIHDALLEAIECGVTEVAARDLRDHYQHLLEINPRNGKSHIQIWFDKVQNTIHHRLQTSIGFLPVNRVKNRYASIDMIPYDKNRCRLKSIPGTQGSDYINASGIDGYHRCKEFIATQGPLPDTENDFWRMMWEQKCSTIVMLTKEHEEDKVKCHTYWPKSGAGQYDSLQVILHNTTEYPDYILREFNLVDTRDQSSLPVKQFQYTDWPEHGVPDTGSGLIDLIGQVQKWQRSCGPQPVVVHCSGGCGRTGTFIAISILIERLKTEGVVDVFQTVRKLRLQRPGMVASLEQYEFCFKTVLEFLDSFELYSNFK